MRPVRHQLFVKALKELDIYPPTALITHAAITREPQRVVMLTALAMVDSAELQTVFVIISLNQYLHQILASTIFSSQADISISDSFPLELTEMRQ